jgi:hypothetical protein
VAREVAVVRDEGEPIFEGITGTVMDFGMAEAPHSSVSTMLPLGSGNTGAWSETIVAVVGAIETVLRETVGIGGVLIWASLATGTSGSVLGSISLSSWEPMSVQLVYPMRLFE